MKAHLLAALAAVTLLTACNGPLGPIPGGALTGPESGTTSFAFAAPFDNLELELNPEAPYSVRVNFALRDGRLYVDPDPERRWAGYLADGATARVRFDKDIYPVTARLVTDPTELEGMEPGRIIYRLEPRYGAAR
jgi:hypothetical protein